MRVILSQSDKDRFWKKVDKTATCWNWTASSHEFGYGVFGVGYRTYKAHRISYLIIHEEIPNGMCVCHKCDNPKCVNPDHLFLGTVIDNNEDMIKKGRQSKPPSMGGWNKKQLPDSIIPLLGKVADTEIGRSIGVSKYVIQRFRTGLGIPALPSQTRFTSGGPHPCWSRKKGGTNAR